MDGVFAGDDIGDGRARLLGRRRLFGLSLGVVFDHFDGSILRVSKFVLRVQCFQSRVASGIVLHTCKKDSDKKSESDEVEETATEKEVGLSEALCADGERFRDVG